jgi:hypothetical protein
LPFRGDTSGVIFDGILNRPTPPLRLNPDLPLRLEDLINKALEQDVKLRCQSCRRDARQIWNGPGATPVQVTRLLCRQTPGLATHYLPGNRQGVTRLKPWLRHYAPRRLCQSATAGCHGCLRQCWWRD